MCQSLSGIGRQDLPKESLEFDKVLLLAVWPRGGGYQVGAREFDCRTGLWSPPVVRPLGQLAELADASVDALFAAFAPLARLSTVQGSRVGLRLRAGALKPCDAALAPVKPGTVFRLVSATLPDGGAVRGVSAIPWTFATVEEVREEELRARLETGLRDPLAGRWETALEVLALAVVPSGQPSRLTLTASGQPARPLVGYDVLASTPSAEPEGDSPILAASMPQKSGQSPSAGRPRFLGRTDRQGALAVPWSGSPLEILLVRHGDQWLARLPVAPGLEPQLTVALTPDEHGIERQALLAGLRDTAVGLAVRQATLAARLKAAVDAKRLDQARQILKEIRALPPAAGILKGRREELAGDIPCGPDSQDKIAAALAELQAALDAQRDRQGVDTLAKPLDETAAPPPGAKVFRFVRSAGNGLAGTARRRAGADD